MTHGPTTFAAKRGLRPKRVRIARGLVLCVVLTPLAGCAFRANLLALFNDEQPPVIPVGASAGEIVSHLNANISTVHGWRSSHARIQAHGNGAVPVPLLARIDVEAPRNFRLKVLVMSSPQADLGSNSERFWFWMREGQPRCVFTARHDELDKVHQLPFEPHWVMQALGVVPMNPAEYELERPGEKKGIAELVAKSVASDGRPARHIVRVDTQAGQIIGHELYDSTNKLIARAELSEYRPESVNGVMLPHEVRLDWPQFGFGLKMTMRDIEVNPTNTPAVTWTMPNYKTYATLDLAHLPPSMQRSMDDQTRRNIPYVQVPDESRLDGGGTEDETYQQLGGEQPWVPPTVEPTPQADRSATRTRWSPPPSEPSGTRSPQRRNWLQRMFGF